MSMIKAWQENEHEKVDYDSINSLLVDVSDVAESSRRMVGNTAIRYFVSENQGKVICKISLNVW